MRIEHVALWVSDLQLIKNFYQKFFDAKSNELYHNTKTGFKSFFLTFDGGARIEIMSRPDVFLNRDQNPQIGYAHLAISVGSKEKVNALTESIRHEGFEVFSEPRTTGDGYYESVVKDPDGNLIEITI